MSGVSYPWYDAPWLSAYVEAKKIIERSCPKKLRSFESAMRKLQAPDGYQVKKLAKVLDAASFARIKKVIAELQQAQLKQDELFDFGRLIVQDHHEFTDIQQSLTATVSTLVGESVQPCYNFLSLYNNLGICKVHMDAPVAKWTLDICIEQSEPWPIHISQCLPWPEQFEQTQSDWHSQILGDSRHRFQKHSMQENEAILFCGSNQWHYRDRISRAKLKNFCHLLFLHYVPVNSENLLYPGCWREYFDIPELEPLTDARFGLDYWAENRQGTFVEPAQA